MIRFELHQRIVIRDSEYATLVGRTGTVVRRRMQDTGAWVDIDGDLPEEARCFSADDDKGRGNHIVLYPEDCEEVG